MAAPATRRRRRGAPKARIAHHAAPSIDRDGLLALARRRGLPELLRCSPSGLCPRPRGDLRQLSAEEREQAGG